MSYFDDASLVMIPSGYKDQKVYSVKPLDGSGDLTFSRASSATRVQSNGLIEKVRTNNYLYSNTFTDAAWTNLRMNFTASAAANPLTGTNDAFKARPSTDSGIHAIRQTIVYGVLSIYAKKGENNKIGFRDDGDTGFYATFNLDTGVLIEKSASALASITALSGGWYRVQFAVPTSSSKLAGIYFLDNAYSSGSPVSNTYAGNGTDGLFIYASQAESGDIATDYIPTTTAAVSVGPVSGLPRLDYLNSTCPRLLLEPQRTNKWFFTEQFDNAEWLKSNVTITANAAVSPDGYTNADKIVDTTANDEHRIRATSALFTITTATTFSIFAKAAEYTRFAIANLSASEYVKFNLSTGTVISTGTGFSNATITNYGNGWYRLSATTSTSGTHGYGLLNDAGNFIFTGTGTKGVFIYGAQAEEAAYATSYIPTLGTSVTRVADLAQKTSASALIGQTEGTVYWEIEVFTAPNVGAEDILVVDNGAATNLLYISKSFADNSLIADMYVASVRQAFFQTSALSIGTHKAAIAYANNNTAFFVDGVQVGTTDTSCSVPAMSRIQLGNGVLGPSVNKTAQLLLFKTRLTNAQLAELTTL